MPPLIFALVLVQVVISKSCAFVPTNPNCECGVPNSDLDERIVGGTIPKAHRYPWMAALFYKNSYFCGGVLISDRYVLTAGHCISRLKSKKPDVALGIHDLNNLQEGVVVPGIQTKLHPGFAFQPVRDLHDIALIKLARPVNFTRNIRPICLPTQGRNYLKLEAQVTGWGVTEPGNEIQSSYLKETTLNLIPLEKCASTQNGPYLTRNMLCAYADGTDACQGDSGGPLVLKSQQNKYETIGVVSWGLGCASRGLPGVFTNVGHYLNWILSSTQDSIYCKR